MVLSGLSGCRVLVWACVDMLCRRLSGWLRRGGGVRFVRLFQNETVKGLIC